MPTPDPGRAASPGAKPGRGAGRSGDDSHLFGHRLIRPRRFVIPHPLIALLGAAGILAIYEIGQARGYSSLLDYAPWLVGFLMIFSYISRRSARNEVRRQERELEELRNRPVWNLEEKDDESDPDRK